MTPEIWSTLASVATLVVITATAIAALVQLKHIRRANQIAGLQSVFEMLQREDTRELMNFVRHDLAGRMNDEAFRASLLEVPIDRTKHPELYLCDMYNHIGGAVRNGLIDEEIYLQTEWYNVNLYWSLLEDEIAQMRKDKRMKHTVENFEWLAAKAKAWAEKHPQGDYPSDVPRMRDEW
jgi:hypothetical protein